MSLYRGMTPQQALGKEKYAPSIPPHVRSLFRVSKLRKDQMCALCQCTLPAGTEAYVLKGALSYACPSRVAEGAVVRYCGYCWEELTR
jgi:hypothetical protein